MARVQSYGATQEVTGSCHILTIENKKIMIDCGMFQGEYEEQNAKPFEFNPREIDYLFITHGHLDHVGRLPKLIKEGFEGKIYTTLATMDLSYLILMDSAKIMSEDFNTRYKKALRKNRTKKLQKPIYTPLDVEKTFTQIEWINPEYNTYYNLYEGISFRFKDAGHILGSGFIEFSFIKNGKSKTIVFSGDIGNNNHLVLPDLQKCTSADYLYVESTYGDREHQSIQKSIKEFKKVILTTLEHKGNILIPSFAIERTQEILCILKEMYDNNELPKCKIYLDSPMAIRTTKIYNTYTQNLSRQCQKNLKKDGSVFQFDLLTYTVTPEASKGINDIKTKAIIIAGSGMCNGGRILHHFKHRIWNKNNAIIFVGYQAQGTLGREIIDGAKWINIYGEDIIVKASIHTINGFSAHADQKGIIKWIKKIKKLKKVFLIHGEKENQKILKDVLTKELDRKVKIVKYKEKVIL